MLRYGITEYRLPRDVLNSEIDYLSRVGLDFETGCRVGLDLQLEEMLERGFVATLLAVGAQRGRPLRVPGAESCAGVEDALAFLRRVNHGDRSPVKGRVVVIGGGSTAVEAARSALRLGAESVDIVYRRYREELLADEEEIRAAESEGIAFRFLVAPSRLLMGNGALQALECVRVGLGEPDASGRRRPIQIPGSEFRVEADRSPGRYRSGGRSGFHASRDPGTADGERVVADRSADRDDRPAGSFRGRRCRVGTGDGYRCYRRRSQGRRGDSSLSGGGQALDSDRNPRRCAHRWNTVCRIHRQ